MTVYADELFIINFISCLAMLYIFAAFVELERKRRRLILASIAGALLALIRFCTSDTFAAIAMIFELIIPLIAFKGIRSSSILLFILMKYVFSGIVTGTVSLIGGSSAVIRGGVIYFNIPPLLFLTIFTIVYPLFSLSLHILKQHKKRRLYTLLLRIGNNDIMLHALYDSGNMLVNPYDKSAVIIAERDSIDFDEENGFMLIPYKSLNHSAILKAFKAESVLCIEKNITIKNVTIGISERKLSETGQYNALIGPAIFKE